MPTYEFDKPHHLSRLHDELIADGITPESVRGQPDGDLFWITVPAVLQPQVSAVVEAHDAVAVLEELAWEFARDKRNRLLSECDWTCVTDTQLSEADQTSWQTYRQALRDVPQNENDPENITWPDAPSG
jgi:hypothetical protein